MGKPVEFVKRAAVEECTVYRSRRWRTVCGRFAVSEFVRLLEGGVRVYYAERLNGGCWDVVSRHRKRAAAVAAVNREARRSGVGR